MIETDAMSQNNKTEALSHTLLGEGKSTRLMELREKVMATPEPVIEFQPANEKAEFDGLDKVTKEALVQIRGLIDQRITEIVGRYPVNKQGRFFKIRFGLEVEQLKILSIKEICSVIGLEQKSCRHISIAGLDYFGNVVTKE
jgi:hypothetical protein